MKWLSEEERIQGEWARRKGKKWPRRMFEQHTTGLCLIGRLHQRAGTRDHRRPDAIWLVENAGKWRGSKGGCSRYSVDQKNRQVLALISEVLSREGHFAPILEMQLTRDEQDILQ